jgi:hypothetical protein
MHHRRILPLAIVLFAASAARTAYADISIGAEAGALYMTRGAGDSRFGFGFAGRLGYDLDLSIIHIIPEVKVAYDRLPLFYSNPVALGDTTAHTNLLRPMVGARVTIGIAVIAIAAYAHVGYAGRLGGEQVDASGLVYEFGGGIDFTPIPIIDIGIWGGWNQVRSGGGYDWASFGVQLTITI